MKYFLSLAALLFISAAQASIVYVDIDSNALIPGGNSWSQAYRSIESAFDSADPGDQIWVAEGTYYEDKFRCGQGIDIYCGFQGWETSLSQRDWENNICIFSHSTDLSLVWSYMVLVSTEGLFTSSLVDGARFQNWGFITNVRSVFWVNSDVESMIFNNCSFSTLDINENFIERYFPTNDMVAEFNNCEFFNILTDEVAYKSWETAEYTYTDCSFDLCRFGPELNNWNFRKTDFVNTSFFGCEMPALANNSCSFNSCLVEDCEFTSANLSAINDADIVNCTFVNNDCERRLCANVNIYNSILYGNTSAAGFNHLSNSQATALNCMLQQEFTGPGGNNSLEDPLFEDPSTGNWCLSECSPAIDNTQIGISIYPLDLKGNPRVYNNELDIGCYEFQGASKKIIYVDHAATGANNGSSWDNAFTQLQNALLAACENSEIWVAKGNYFPNQTPASVNRFASFSLPTGAKMYGGFTGDESSIDDRPLDIWGSGNFTKLLGTNGTTTTTDDAYHILVISGSEDVILDGFYFAYGKADGSGTFGSGGAIWMQGGSAAVNNCRFEANYGLTGGAIYAAADAQLEIIDSQFSFNSCAYEGGAIRCNNSGNLTPDIFIDRCWFIGNSASNGGGLNLGAGNYEIANSILNINSANENGSAIYSTGTLNVVNCTVHGQNEAMYLAGVSSFYNSIFWGNTTDFVDAPSIVSKTIQYCNLSAPTPGTGNTSQDPSFVNEINWDFNLSLGSPMLNAGSNANVIGELDRAGLTRISDGTVDKGAYEYNVPCASSNDLCEGASDIDVSVANTVFADMTCATAAGDIVVSSCGITGAKSVWYHFVMPNHRIQFYLGDTPEDYFGDRVLSVFKGSCANPIGSYCGQYLLIGPGYIAPGEDVFIKLTEWNQPDVVSFNIVPIIPEITLASVGQQSDCQPGTPFSTYLQQVTIHYENTETYTQMEVNGLLYELTGSPQLINMESVIATGDFWDLEISIPDSDANLTVTDFTQAPCCAAANDNCGNPSPLTFGIPDYGQTNCASTEVDDVLSSCTIGLGNSLWYEFAAPTSGAVFLQGDIIELGTPTNFRISVWDLNDGCADPVEVGCINNYGNNVGESGEVSGLNPGQVYGVRVSGYQQQQVTFAITVFEIEATCGCTGDYNADCDINSADLLNLLSGFGCAINCGADLNNDEVVNSADLLVFLSVFGSSCIQ